MLKLMYNQIDTNNSTSYYFSGIKSFCPVRNNQPALYAIKKLNTRNKALSIATYDFSTLNTNILHNKLKNVMRDEFLFQKR